MPARLPTSLSAGLHEALPTPGPVGLPAFARTTLRQPARRKPPGRGGGDCGSDGWHRREATVEAARLHTDSWTALWHGPRRLGWCEKSGRDTAAMVRASQRLLPGLLLLAFPLISPGGIRPPAVWALRPGRPRVARIFHAVNLNWPPKVVAGSATSVVASRSRKLTPFPFK